MRASRLARQRLRECGQHGNRPSTPAEGEVANAVMAKARSRDERRQAVPPATASGQLRRDHGRAARGQMLADDGISDRGRLCGECCRRLVEQPQRLPQQREGASRCAVAGPAGRVRARAGAAVATARPPRARAPSWSSARTRTPASATSEARFSYVVSSSLSAGRWPWKTTTSATAGRTAPLHCHSRTTCRPRLRADPATMRSSVVLPLPLAPADGERAAGLDAKRDAAEKLRVAARASSACTSRVRHDVADDDAHVGRARRSGRLCRGRRRAA